MRWSYAHLPRQPRRLPLFICIVLTTDDPTSVSASYTVPNVPFPRALPTEYFADIMFLIG